MDREPTYPKDMPVGGPAEAPQDSATTADIAEDPAGESNLTRNIVAGAALGIGSAALVAALLYANRSRKNGKPSEKTAKVPPQLDEQPES